MNSDEVKAVALTALAENYGQTFSDTLLILWLNLLDPYTPEEVEKAVRAVLESYEYRVLPPFAVLKRALDGLRGVSHQALEVQALAEWAALQAAVGKVGSYGRPELHPTTAAVVRLMGGWAAVCAWESRYVDLRRKDFVQLWKEAHGREEALGLGSGAVAALLAAGPDSAGRGPRALAAAFARPPSPDPSPPAPLTRSSGNDRRRGGAGAASIQQCLEGE